MAGSSWLRSLLRGTAQPPPGRGAQDQTPSQGQSKKEHGKPQVTTGSVKAALLATHGPARLPQELAAALEQYRAARQATHNAGSSSDGKADPGRWPRTPQQAAELARALQEADQKLGAHPLPSALPSALAIMQEMFADCVDVVFRGLLVGGKRAATLIFTDGMVSEDRLELSVLQPLTQWPNPEQIPTSATDLRAWLQNVGMSINNADTLDSISKVVQAVLSGEAVLLVDGVENGVAVAAAGWYQRAVEEPTSESVIRGPREGFVESIRTNTMLLRRRIKTPLLKIERTVLGQRTRTLIDLIYVQGVADPSLVAEVRRRLDRIVVDGILDSGQLEEWLEDEPLSLFPQLINTERPDRVAADLLEGRVALLVDGSPFALVAPATFWSMLQAGEDYYERFWIGTFLRWLRYLFLLIALTGPSLYIAIGTFHARMLPTALLLSIASAREGIPFPAVVEALIMEVFFEALREAGVRLPRPVGQAVSIVGALVIGQAAVQAGLVSAPVVIIVGITGIASFTVPRFSLGIPIRLLRFMMMLLAGTLGFFGLMVGLLALLVHLCSLRSFGVPYLQPAAPISWPDLKDMLMRAPAWRQRHRPITIAPLDRERQRSEGRASKGGRQP